MRVCDSAVVSLCVCAYEVACCAKVFRCDRVCPRKLGVEPICGVVSMSAHLRVCRPMCVCARLSARMARLRVLSVNVCCPTGGLSGLSQLPKACVGVCLVYACVRVFMSSIPGWPGLRRSC